MVLLSAQRTIAPTTATARTAATIRKTLRFPAGDFNVESLMVDAALSLVLINLWGGRGGLLAIAGGDSDSSVVENCWWLTSASFGLVSSPCNQSFSSAVTVEPPTLSPSSSRRLDSARAYSSSALLWSSSSSAFRYALRISAAFRGRRLRLIDIASWMTSATAAEASGFSA